jgi:hypothetical protein
MTYPRAAPSLLVRPLPPNDHETTTRSSGKIRRIPGNIGPLLLLLYLNDLKREIYIRGSFVLFLKGTLLS